MTILIQALLRHRALKDAAWIRPWPRTRVSEKSFVTHAAAFQAAVARTIIRPLSMPASTFPRRRAAHLLPLPDLPFRARKQPFDVIAMKDDD